MTDARSVQELLSQSEALVKQLGPSAYKDQFATVQHLLSQNATLVEQVTERQETAEASGSTAELEENVPLMNALNANITKVSRVAPAWWPSLS